MFKTLDAIAENADHDVIVVGADAGGMAAAYSPQSRTSACSSSATIRPQLSASESAREPNGSGRINGSPSLASSSQRH
jgi:hypothetical protein